MIQVFFLICSCSSRARTVSSNDAMTGTARKGSNPQALAAARRVGCGPDNAGRVLWADVADRG